MITRDIYGPLAASFNAQSIAKRVLCGAAVVATDHALPGAVVPVWLARSSSRVLVRAIASIRGACSLRRSAFTLLAAAGWVLEYLGFHSRLLALPHYFVLANLASLLAFFKFVSGESVCVVGVRARRTRCHAAFVVG